MKVWIARDNDGLTAFEHKPFRYYPFDDDDFIFRTATRSSRYVELDERLLPQVTIENSPVELDLDIEF
jgi:hypothetical protein